EYGRASGGRVNLRTRSGSDRFHTSAFYFFRDEALNANTFHNNSLGLSRLPLQEHAGGFSVGGPVFRGSRGESARNRKSTVFFVAYERSHTLDSALVDTLVPVGQNELYSLPAPTHSQQRRVEDVEPPARTTEIAPFIASLSTPLKNTSLTARVDHQFSETHNASFVYQSGRLANLRQFGGGNRLADALQARNRSSDALSFSDNLVLSSRVVNQLRFQYSRLAPSFKTRAAGTPVVLITLNDPLTKEDPERRTGTLIAGSSTLGGSDRQEQRAQLQQILSFISGNHSLKFVADLHYV